MCSGLIESNSIAIFQAGEDNLTNPLRILFPRAEDIDSMEGDDSEEVRRLDLTNALGRWLPMNALRRNLFIGHAPSAVAPDSTIASTGEGAPQAVPDSWEDESDAQASGLPAPSVNAGHLMNSLITPRFPNLRHLSLALDPMVKPSKVSWASLLSVAADLPTLESLSLAYWPLPTYTPEAASTFTTINSNVLGSKPRLVYGGTNMYSAMDNDWRESAGILKSLSRSLYCLKWLDLTGCVPWLQALVWEGTHPSTPSDAVFGAIPAVPPSPAIWNGHWRAITWLGLGVGWAPISEGGLSSNTFHVGTSRQYKTLVASSQRVAKQIQQKRLSGKGQMIHFDYTDGSAT